MSPLLANLYLHYAFDVWMSQQFPHVVFERYADDIVVHARSQSEAELLKEAISKRLGECKLELHPQKTKIVFCKQWNRQGDWPTVSFIFLGYEFRPREVVNQKQGRFRGFLPAVSKKALLRMRQTIRQWQLISMCHMELEDISEEYGAMIQGWIQYYGRFYKRELFPLLQYIDTAISRWASRKFRRFHGRLKKAREWVSRLAKREPTLFPHWEMASYKAVEQ